jgi:molecular chaperone DnaK
MAKLVQKNTTIPTKASQKFSTAEDNQAAVTIKAFQGERELVQYNKLLGEFNLEGIDPAPRGMPQVEVSFDIDANGIMHVSAKDKKTGKENKITIKSNSGLSEAEIEQMIKDAEANADADKKARELIETRNQAEGQVHAVRKDFEEYKDQLTEEQKTEIETALTEVEEAAKGNDVDAIKSAIEKVYPAMKSLLDKKAEAEAAKTAAEAAPQDDNVVDATFTETKEEGKN